LLRQHGPQVRQLGDRIGDNMNGHEQAGSGSKSRTVIE
jgi:hypothetical protein